MAKSFTYDRIARQAPAELIEVLRAQAEPLPAPQPAEEFGAFFDRYGDARVVLLGEATHGTSDFYLARAATTRRLVQRPACNVSAVEADWQRWEERRVGQEWLSTCRCRGLRDL